MSAPTLAAAQPAETSLKDDLLTGVAAIAAFTGDSEASDPKRCPKSRRSRRSRRTG